MCPILRFILAFVVGSDRDMLISNDKVFEQRNQLALDCIH